MALLLPVRYRTISGVREHVIHAYERTAINSTRSMRLSG
jgi:hypothetical protein